MYVCMYVSMYVCMSVCMSVCLSVCMYVCLFVCMYVYIFIHMFQKKTKQPRQSGAAHCLIDCHTSMESKGVRQTVGPVSERPEAKCH